MKFLHLIPARYFFQGGDDAFFVADLGDVVRKHLRWTRALPRVQPYYAVKCNPSRAVVMALAALGAGFDCASKVRSTYSIYPTLLPSLSCHSYPSTDVSICASLGEQMPVKLGLLPVDHCPCSSGPNDPKVNKHINTKSTSEHFAHFRRSHVA